MTQEFIVDIQIGEDVDGKFFAFCNSALKFWFVADTEDILLKKIDDALVLYARYRKRLLTEFDAQQIDISSTNGNNLRLIQRTISLEACA